MKKILFGGLGVAILSFAFAVPAMAATITVGNDSSVRATLDTYKNFIVVDTNNPVSVNGWLTSFSYYAANKNSFEFVLVDAGYVVKWISPPITPASVGVQTYSISVPVQAGWNLGVHFDSSGTIPFDYIGLPATYTPNNNGMPVVGVNLTVESTSNRVYSWSGSGTDEQTCSTINLASGTKTQTAGYTETTLANSSAGLSLSSYPPGILNSAVVTEAVIPPWVDPTTDTDFSGTGALWISTAASNNEGNPTADQWRLFQDSFTLPTNAAATPAALAYTADNAAEAYLNGNTISSTPEATYGASSDASTYATVYTTSFLPTAGTNTLDFVVRNLGGNYSSNPTGLLYQATVNYCQPVLPSPPTSVNVHIFKYIDDVQATTNIAGGVKFPMFTSTYQAPFTLGPGGWTGGDVDYEASTGANPLGFSYSANEDTSTSLVSAGPICDGIHPYALVGYTTGDTLFTAQQNPATSTVPIFTNLQGDKYIIVWNKTCAVTPPIKVHILKYLDGVEATAASANSYLFPMTATWKTANLNGGVSTSGNYVLGNSHGGAPDLYGADTASMSVPADYTTSEITDGTSQIVASPESCVPGKYRLDGYQTSAVGFAEAAIQATSTTPANFTGLEGDQYVIVRNITCPTKGSLIVNKITIGGNNTFSFTGDNSIGSFKITTTNNSGYATFSDLTPGTYHVTEVNNPKGWTQTTDSDCSAVTVAAGQVATCTITNTSNKLLGAILGAKLEDKNGDGKLNDGFNRRLAGWTIYIDKNTSGVLDAGDISTVTDSHGNYRFVGLVAGTYVVREEQQKGWIQTYPSSDSYTIVLAAGKVSKKINFGNFKLGIISGIKYNDLNGNGRKDKNEPGLLDWTINLKGPGVNGTTVPTVTDASGNYSFTGLKAGTYTLSEVMQSGWHQTDHPNKVKVQSGSNSTRDDFGNTQKVIRLYDWNNKNHDE